MQIKKNYVLGLGLALAFTLTACGKDEKTKTVTVENAETVKKLEAAQKELVDLKEKLKVAGEIDGVALKAELAAANTKIEELNTSITAKDTAITDTKKELEDAKKSGDAKVADLEGKLKNLEAEKAKLVSDLAAAQGDKTQLTALVEAAQRDEVMYKKVLDYAVASGAKDRDSIAASLDKDLADIEATLASLAAQEPGLKDSITSQAQVVVKAAVELENVSSNIKGIFAALSERATKGETLSTEDQGTLDTLKAYFDAATGEETEKKNKAAIEKVIEGLNKDITGLNATLTAADAELKRFNEELLALALTDTKLESPRAKELTTLISARKETIATTVVAKDEKSKALTEQNDLLKASKEKIAGLVTVQAEKLLAYNDTAVSAARETLTQAEKELDARVAAYQTSLAEVAATQGKKSDVTALKDFFTGKLKPVQG